MTKALTSAATGGGRFHELDALRGVAALAVVFSHCIVIILQDATLAEGLLKDALRTVKYSPLGWAVAGLPAVLLFFTLSGFVLARMLEGARIAYPGYAVKRIARIWLPYLVSVLLAMLLISTLGWMRTSAPNYQHWKKRQQALKDGFWAREPKMACQNVAIVRRAARHRE